MTYLSPLAYLVGLEGAALLRGLREGFGDRDYVEARIAEIRALLDAPELAAAGGVTAVPGAVSVSEVYRDWAPTYDDPGNGMIEREQPIVRGIVDTLPVGTALDAACGTGRHTAYLAELGHRVVGVDGSPQMLAIARERLPQAEFHQADLHALPVPDDSADTVLCTLALSYVKDLAPVFAQFARVLRPGGHLIVTDAHVIQSYLRPTIAHRTDGGAAAILEEFHRPLSHYLAAALPLGFQVRSCEEVGSPWPREEQRLPPAPDVLPTVVDWDVLQWCPEAAIIALDVPYLVVWHFQLASDS